MSQGGRVMVCDLVELSDHLDDGRRDVCQCLDRVFEFEDSQLQIGVGGGVKEFHGFFGFLGRVVVAVGGRIQ